jgi:hypothetical protein
MTLLLASIQVAKRNRLPYFYRMLKLFEVSDLSFLRSNRVIRPGEPPKGALAPL